MTGVPNATAGTGAITPAPQPHPWQADIPDPGERPRCRCGSENRAGHPKIPNPRSEK